MMKQKVMILFLAVLLVSTFSFTIAGVYSEDGVYGSSVQGTSTTTNNINNSYTNITNNYYSANVSDGTANSQIVIWNATLGKWTPVTNDDGERIINITTSNPTLILEADVNNRKIIFQPALGSIDSSGTAFQLNRYSGNEVAIGQNSDSRFKVGQGDSVFASLIYAANTITNIPAIIARGAWKQTANIFEVRNVNDTIMFSVSKNGSVEATEDVATGNLNVAGNYVVGKPQFIIENSNVSHYAYIEKMGFVLPNKTGGGFRDGYPELVAWSGDGTKKPLFQFNGYNDGQIGVQASKFYFFNNKYISALATVDWYSANVPVLGMTSDSVVDIGARYQFGHASGAELGFPVSFWIGENTDQNTSFRFRFIDKNNAFHDLMRVAINGTAFGSNTLNGLILGDINGSTGYFDVLTEKSPFIFCSQESNKCKVEDIDNDKIYYIEKDKDWKIKSIKDKDKKDITIDDTTKQVKEKLKKLEDKTTCSNNGYYYTDGICYETIRVSKTYSEAVEQIPVYEKTINKYSCTQLDDNLQEFETICEDEVETENIINYDYRFKDGCDWNNGYYCMEKQEVVL